MWPEMRAALSAAGWCNYSLFLQPDGLIVGYMETSDFANALQRMKDSEVNERWQREMAPFFETINGIHADDQMIPLEEVFHQD